MLNRLCLDVTALRCCKTAVPKCLCLNVFVFRHIKASVPQHLYVDVPVFRYSGTTVPKPDVCAWICLPLGLHVHAFSHIKHAA